MLRLELAKHPNPEKLLQLLAADSLKDLTLKALDTAVVYATPQEIPSDLKNWDWFVGSQTPNAVYAHVSNHSYAIGDRLEIDAFQSQQQLRPIGFAPQILQVSPSLADRIIDIDDVTILPKSADLSIELPQQNIVYAPDLPLTLNTPTKSRQRYPIVRGKGQIDGSVACFENARHPL